MHRDENTLKAVKVHSALNRPNLLLGAERELTLMLGLICTIMVFLALTWQTALLGIVLWGVLLTLLRMMAKADPMMSKIYLRHLRYKAFYPAHSTPFRSEK
jgi:type IV secretion system protein VirB3